MRVKIDERHMVNALQKGIVMVRERALHEVSSEQAEVDRIVACRLPKVVAVQQCDKNDMHCITAINLLYHGHAARFCWVRPSHCDRDTPARKGVDGLAELITVGVDVSDVMSERWTRLSARTRGTNNSR